MCVCVSRHWVLLVHNSFSDVRYVFSTMFIWLLMTMRVLSYLTPPSRSDSATGLSYYNRISCFKQAYIIDRAGRQLIKYRLRTVHDGPVYGDTICILAISQLVNTLLWYYYYYIWVTSKKALYKYLLLCGWNFEHANHITTHVYYRGNERFRITTKSWRNVSLLLIIKSEMEYFIKWLLVIRAIVMTMSMQSFIHDSPTNNNNEETFL